MNTEPYLDGMQPPSPTGFGWKSEPSRLPEYLPLGMRLPSFCTDAISFALGRADKASKSTAKRVRSALDLASMAHDSVVSGIRKVQSFSLVREAVDEEPVKSTQPRGELLQVLAILASVVLVVALLPITFVPRVAKG